jgi:hypothetical protein
MELTSRLDWLISSSLFLMNTDFSFPNDSILFIVDDLWFILLHFMLLKQYTMSSIIFI